jgi:hypothetical protein
MQIYIFVSNYIYYFVSILIVSVSIIFNLKSSLAKNCLIYPFLHTIFNFLLNYVLPFRSNVRGYQLVLYIYSTCWHMKLVFYKHQHIPQA